MKGIGEAPMKRRTAFVLAAALAAFALAAPGAVLAGDKAAKPKSGGGGQNDGGGDRDARRADRQLIGGLKSEIKQTQGRAERDVRDVERDARRQVGELRAGGGSREAIQAVKDKARETASQIERAAREAERELREQLKEAKDRLRDDHDDKEKGHGKGKDGEGEDRHEGGKDKDKDKDKDKGKDEGEGDDEDEEFDADAAREALAASASGAIGGDHPAPRPPLPPKKDGAIAGAPDISGIREAGGWEGGGSARAGAPLAKLAPPARPPETSARVAAPEVALDKGVLLQPGEGATTAERAEKHAAAAATYRHMGEHPRALEASGKAIALDPANAKAHAERAAALLRLGDYAGAAAAAAKAAELDPGNPLPLKLLADAKYRLGDLRGALAAVERWLALAPKDANALHRKAVLLDALGDKAGALAALEAAVAINPRLRPVVAEYLKGGRLRYPDDEDIDPTAADPDRPAPGGHSLPLVLGVAGFLALAGALLARRKPEAAAPVLEPAPSRLGEKFEVLRELERGAGGTLLEARDRKLERTVLIRRFGLGADPEAREARLRALKTAAAVRHRGLFDVYEVLEDGTDACVVTERPGGRSAAAMLADAGRFPLAQAAVLLEPVCSALEAAHAQGVHHGRLSLGSVFVTDQGVAKLGDLASAPGAGEGGDAGSDVEGLARCLREMSGGQLSPELERGLRGASGPAEFLARLKEAARPAGAVR